MMRAVSSPLRCAVGVALTDPALVVEIARASEAAGVARLFISETPFGPDALTMTAHVLGRTETIAVGPGLAGALDRHPLVLARQVATCSRIAPGRVLLGLGRTSRTYIEDRMGLPFAPATERLRETLLVLGPLLSGAAVSFHGTHLSAESAPLLERGSPKVPVFLGASGQRTLDLAGQLTQGVVLNGGATPAFVGWAASQVAAAARAAGRDPREVEVMAWCLASIRRDGRWDPPLDRLRRQLAEILHAADAGVALLRRSGLEPEIQLRLEQARRLGVGALEQLLGDQAMLSRLTVMGDPDQCRLQLGKLHEHGATWVVLQPTALAAMTDSGAGWPLSNQGSDLGAGI